MTKFLIPDMSCGHCKSTIETTVKSLEPAATLDFDMAQRSVEIVSAALVADILAALNSAGYPATTD